MVSLARGAASPFEMRGFGQRRANQLTIQEKELSAEKLNSAALTGSSSGNLGGFFPETED